MDVRLELSIEPGGASVGTQLKTVAFLESDKYPTVEQ